MPVVGIGLKLGLDSASSFTLSSRVRSGECNVASSIHSLGQLTPTQRTDLRVSLVAGDYNLFLGAGVSLDATNGRGEDLPSGAGLKADLCKLTGSRQSSTLQRVFGALSQEQVDLHITQRFANCKSGPSLSVLPKFVWKRIYTLNIDDALEAAYELPGNYQAPMPIHFKDTYQDVRSSEGVPIIHLHGWARQSAKGYVFSREEYARVMSEANAWMTVLAEVMPVEPFIISGTGLDEIDLSFYLSRRSSSTTRKDRGPSFFVEPYPDGQTPQECEKFGLILYEGTIEKFTAELNQLAPSRPTPFELLPADTAQLFPDDTDQSVVHSFAADFDRVPHSPPVTGEGIKFARGNPPEWSDLARNWDVGRSLTTRVRSTVEACLAGSIAERVVIVLDDTGAGKTTVVRRVALDLARKGVVTLNCTALARLDAKSTAAAINMVSNPLLIVVDNLADQASSIAAIRAALVKRDVVFLGAERRYRSRHILRSIGDAGARVVDGLNLTFPEAQQLVKTYVQRGIAGAKNAAQAPDALAQKVKDEPIAVACCHILKDMKPLDSIVDSTYLEAIPQARSRYLMAALAQYCYSGGVRYDVLSTGGTRAGWDEQFEDAHPLPLDYFDDRRTFVVPLNATLAERTLARASQEDVAKAFERLALGIAPRVNRETIKMRSPEARLAGRLFDFDDVLKRYLPNGAEEFYRKARPSWQWNARYWEQVALFNLSVYRVDADQARLQLAISHARHAVSLDPNAFPLTTLGKILLSQLPIPGANRKSIYSEAFESLAQAIEKESLYGRASVHAYITLFRGTIEYVNFGDAPTMEELVKLDRFADAAERNFPHDAELREVTTQLRQRI